MEETILIDYNLSPSMAQTGISLEDMKRLPKLPTKRISQVIRCLNCERIVKTAILHEPGEGAYCAGIMLCLSGLWFCCFAPCLIEVPVYHLKFEECFDTYHYCVNCGQLLNKRRFMFG